MSDKNRKTKLKWLMIDQEIRPPTSPHVQSKRGSLNHGTRNARESISAPFFRSSIENPRNGRNDEIEGVHVD